MNGIPTIYVDAVKAVIRHLLTALAGILITHGLISASQSAQFSEIGLSVLMFAVTVGWSLFQKYHAKQLQLVSLAANPGTTELQVSQQVAAGVKVPSVLTLPTVAPKGGTAK